MKQNKSNGNLISPMSQIDKIIHEPVRLQIMTHLFVVKNADFIFLMNQLGLTKGNLSSHMTKLESAGYLEVNKEFVKKIPRTVLSLTAPGRKAFRAYRKSITQMLDQLPE